MNSFRRIEDYTFANDFYDFLTCHFKNGKSHVFGNLKKRKIRILEHWGRCPRGQMSGHRVYNATLSAYNTPVLAYTCSAIDR